MHSVKNKIFNVVCLLVLVSLFSCENSSLDNSIDHDIDASTELTFDFDITVPSQSQIVTRQGRVEDLTTLRLLVFDEHDKFVYSRTAILKSIVPANERPFYPENTPNPTDVYTYSVKLISSLKQRTVHFIGNYDWSNFEQDYFLIGLDAGQVVGGLTTTTEVFWRAKSFDKITPAIFEEQTVKLLSNQAQIEVKSSSSSKFDLTGYAVYNTYDRGTVAPFKWDENQMLGYFPVNPTDVTIPANAKSDKKISFSTDPIRVFEQENRGDNIVSILIKGKYDTDSRETYYKLDLRRMDSGTALPSLYSILRNYGYRINLNRIATRGYNTPEEALEQPASNNIFGAIELEDFQKVSDGTNLLEVTVLNATLLYEQQKIKSEIIFSKGQESVKCYPSWGADDPYLKKLDYFYSSSGPAYIEITLNKVPIDRYLNYTVDVVGKVDDGYFITRRVKILVRQPYEFNAGLKAESTKNYLLSFDVPKALPISAFPLDVLIETREMSPRSNNNILMVYKDGTYYYKYVLHESDLDKRIEIPFTKITPDSDKSVNIKLLSDFFTTSELSK